MEYVSVGSASIPALGLGTYGGDPLRGRECVRVVREALDVGYRHIDTAQLYGNHPAIGRAIDESTVPRDRVFLTTKLWKTNMRRKRVLESVTDSLDELGLEYIDLLLVHWPPETATLSETLGAMNDLQEMGKVRNIGVSNFSAAQLREAVATSETPILTNQVKYNPYTGQSELLDCCLDNDVVLTAYSPLAKGRVTGDETLERIGRRYGKSAPQVALRWLIQQDGVAAIPKATQFHHIRADFDVFDFELTNEEMDRIFDLDGGLLYRLRERFRAKL